MFQEKKEDGSQWLTTTIKSVPVPHVVKWSIKENGSNNYQAINVSAEEYNGTTSTFPHPVLVIKHPEKLENCTFKIEAKNRIGKVEMMIPGNNEVFRNNPIINALFIKKKIICIAIPIITVYFELKIHLHSFFHKCFKKRWLKCFTNISCLTLCILLFRRHSNITLTRS